MPHVPELKLIRFDSIKLNLAFNLFAIDAKVMINSNTFVRAEAHQLLDTARQMAIALGLPLWEVTIDDSILSAGGYMNPFWYSIHDFDFNDHKILELADDLGYEACYYDAGAEPEYLSTAEIIQEMRESDDFLEYVAWTVGDAKQELEEAGYAPSEENIEIIKHHLLETVNPENSFWESALKLAILTNREKLEVAPKYWEAA